MISYPRESLELIEMPVSVKVDGEFVPVLEGVEYAILPRTRPETRPSTWAAATVLDGATGYLNTGLTPGSYVAWARVTSAPPEKPVIRCGVFEIS